MHDVHETSVTSVCLGGRKQETELLKLENGRVQTIACDACPQTQRLRPSGWRRIDEKSWGLMCLAKQTNT